MKIKQLFYAQLIVGTFALHAVADEPPTRSQTTDGKPATQTPVADDESLTAEAQGIADDLRATLPVDSEAIAMLNDIIAGSHLSPEDGWFRLAKSQTRYDWQYASKTFDTDKDAVVKANELALDASDFERLDQNNDHQITESDFDWSEHSLMPKPGFIMFFMADRDANGKVTKEEFLNLFSMFGGEDAGFLAMDDLREELQPSPLGDRDQRPDRPSKSTLVLGLKNQEIGSLQSGPNVGDSAPDFSLTSLNGDTVTLSEELGDKPIVLIFGNFTCGPFRSQAGNIEKLYDRYRDRAKFFLVYVREAHPSDGWWMSSNQHAGIDLSQPKENSQRREIAATCQQRLDLNIPFLVDSIDDKVGSTYSGMPNRLYLIDPQGIIAFKNGRGPFGFHPKQLEQALVLMLQDIATKKR